MDFRLLAGSNDIVRIAVPDRGEETFPTVTLKDAEDSVLVWPAMATQDDFQLIRILGMLKVAGPEQKTDFEFQPPARMQVRFTANDLNRAGRRGKPLVLGYWVEDHWQRFPPGNVAADPTTLPDEWSYFLIHAISDPPIAWGT